MFFELFHDGSYSLNNFIELPERGNLQDYYYIENGKYYLDIFTSGTNEPSSVLEEALEAKLVGVIPESELGKCLAIIKTKSNIRVPSNTA